MSEPIVHNKAEAAQVDGGAALILEPLCGFLDSVGLGEGTLEAVPIGEGHSNLTFLLRRGSDRFVLRRPPRGLLSPSANDVLREAGVLGGLAPAGVHVPSVLATCDDASLIGAPFFLMSFVDGWALTETLPAPLRAEGAGQEIAAEMVDALAVLHGVDIEIHGLDSLGRASGYLERQLRRFAGLLESNATRPLPDVESVHAWLVENLPGESETCFVHGDYRLGNLMFDASRRVAAILDWEMATVGDPLADIGYCTAFWAEPGDEENPMLALSRVTRQDGFPDRAWIANRYADATGRSLEALRWYQVLAMWKAAIFLEDSHARFLAGHSSDEYFERLGDGVPLLGRAALERIEST
jgi:aminoglycoside phosphotransferase (APT) family kinase protein